MPNITVVIDRSKWLRGEGGKNSFLRRESDGKQCCLGFAAIAMGATLEEITNKKLLSEVGIIVGEREIYGINDKQWMNERYREHSITSLGCYIGLDFSFVG